jgi:hypothetical protein
MPRPKKSEVDWTKLKPWEKNPYARIPGHPSHTHPDAPEGPDWWRRKGGWDKFAANVFEQTKELGKMVQMLETVCDIREMNFQRTWNRQIHRMRKIRAGYKEIRMLAQAAKRRHAELLAQIRPVEDAMKRGQLALSPEAWERLMRNENKKIHWPTKEKPVLKRVGPGKLITHP